MTFFNELTLFIWLYLICHRQIDLLFFENVIVLNEQIKIFIKFLNQWRDKINSKKSTMIFMNLWIQNVLYSSSELKKKPSITKNVKIEKTKLITPGTEVRLFQCHTMNNLDVFLFFSIPIFSFYIILLINPRCLYLIDILIH